MTFSLPDTDLLIVGGGIVGMATAWTLADSSDRSVTLIEAEKEPAFHQTGHNSGVIHSGLYYKPGSLKASNCVKGREKMFAFCRKHGVPHERTGKLVVATAESQIPYLEELERRGRANGLKGLQRMTLAEMRTSRAERGWRCRAVCSRNGNRRFHGGDSRHGRRVCRLRRKPAFSLPFSRCSRTIGSAGSVYVARGDHLPGADQLHRAAMRPSRSCLRCETRRAHRAVQG